MKFKNSAACPDSPFSFTFVSGPHLEFMRLLSRNLLLAGLLNLLVFLGIFYLLQNEWVYQNTLGKISSNYVRVKVDGDTQIQQIKKPYVDISTNKLQNWDADIYHCIKENMYSTEEGCYIKVKGAFFPLFPLIWKVSTLNSIGVSLLNYFLFVLSLSILVQLLCKGSSNEKLLIYSLLLVLPSTVIYYIPYTEALFLLTMTLAFTGYKKQKYWLFFLAAFAMSMLRPATLFILLSIICVEILFLISHRKPSLFLRNFLKNGLPFVLGYFVAILIQYASSGSLNTMSDAQKYWNGSIGLFTQITDWSAEGFGLNTFSVFFIAIPALYFVVHSIIKKKSFKENYSKSNPEIEIAGSYFFLISVFYLAGIFVFILLSSGGNLHSFFRFTMTSPAFYIAALYILTHWTRERKSNRFALFMIPLSLLTIFLTQTEFGPGRFEFPFYGMYLSILAFLFILIQPYVKKPAQWLIAVPLIVLCIIWNTYLFNIFLCEGWIFT